ncbi:carotenoid oxygenase family protein [Nocardia speluncae]|uniref:carotenoid oxygenase family protein n=1 Tax=Nocardia speluncae TaxID=419477 RepID=UPI001B352A73|nr:carotenoid oxygenase family protein [Nocardia speluncae]
MKDEVTAYDLPVTGRLPTDLDGRYLRVGPNPLGIEVPDTHFWAFGAGMVHGVRIRGGRAEWYRNRWVRSAEVSGALDRMRRGLEPPAFLPPSPNIHVLRHAGRTVALTEAGGLPHELGHELDTLGEFPLAATPEGSSANAHSKVDPRTGDLHSVAYVLGRPFAQYVVTDSAGAITRTADIALPGALPFLHDFALSENFVVVFDIPLIFDMDAMRFRWDATHQAQVGVLPRAGGPVRWFPVESYYLSHVLNAYDDGSTITVDLIAAEGPVDVADPGAIEPRLDRWTIDLRTGRLDQQCTDDRAQDFPRVNDAYASRPYRYGYSAVSPVYGLRAGSDGPRSGKAPINVLIKHDLLRGTAEEHRFGNDAAVGEAAFAADPGGNRNEDAGYLMAYVADPDRGASDLVILSAQDFAGPPVARIHLPVRVPLGFHGNWIPETTAT